MLSDRELMQQRIARIADFVIEATRTTNETGNVELYKQGLDAMADVEALRLAAPAQSEAEWLAEAERQ